MRREIQCLSLVVSLDSDGVLPSSVASQHFGASRAAGAFPLNHHPHKSIHLLSTLHLSPSSMGKNKRKSGMTGLARFVLDSFNNSNGATSNSIEPASEPEPEPAHKLQKVDEEKRVVSSKTYGKRRYDASGLVPHYENAEEVPEHLQKCTSPTLAQKLC